MARPVIRLDVGNRDLAKLIQALGCLRKGFPAAARTAQGRVSAATASGRVSSGQMQHGRVPISPSGLGRRVEQRSIVVLRAVHPVEIDHIAINSAGNGMSRSCGSGS